MSSTPLKRSMHPRSLHVSVQSHPEVIGRIHDQGSTFLELVCQLEGLDHVQPLQQPDSTNSKNP